MHEYAGVLDLTGALPSVLPPIILTSYGAFHSCRAAGQGQSHQIRWSSEVHTESGCYRGGHG